MPDADGNTTPEEAAPTIPAAPALQEQPTPARAPNPGLGAPPLHPANPDLPDAAFAGEDLAAIQTSVTTARAVADHIRQQAEADRNGAANAATAAAVVQTPLTGGAPPPRAAAPDGIKGIDRIKFGLAQRS